MTDKISRNLAARQIELPQVAVPVANYTAVVISNQMAYVSGQLCSWNGAQQFIGKLGNEFGVEDGQKAARLCGLNIIAQLQHAIGDLDKVKRVVRLTVFVNSTPDFTEQPKIANGASDLMVEVFGEIGRHSRSAVGAAQLPLGVAVEVDAVFEIE